MPKKRMKFKEEQIIAMRQLADPARSQNRHSFPLGLDRNQVQNSHRHKAIIQQSSRRRGLKFKEEQIIETRDKPQYLAIQR